MVRIPLQSCYRTITLVRKSDGRQKYETAKSDVSPTLVDSIPSGSKLSLKTNRTFVAGSKKIINMEVCLKPYQLVLKVTFVCLDHLRQMCLNFRFQTVKDILIGRINGFEESSFGTSVRPIFHWMHLPAPAPAHHKKIDHMDPHLMTPRGHRCETMDK